MRDGLALVAVAAVAAALVIHAREPRPRDRDIQLLVADANLAPAELAADALLRIASSPKVADPAWQRELLDDAYMRAYAAQERHRRITGNIPPDTRQGAEARDPRSFSVASIDIISKLADLEDSDRELGITGWHVIRALRQYLVTQLTGPRCSDSVTDGPAVEMFNASVKRRDAIADGVAPLTTADTRPSRLLGVARIDPYWQTVEARRLYDQALRLRGTARNPVPESVRRSPAWRLQAEHLVLDLEQWTGTREPTERDYFYQKSMLFTLLIDMTPPSAERIRVLRVYADFLRHVDLDRVRRALWFAFANRLIELARSPDRQLVLDLLEDSHHPVLSLYGRLERILPLKETRR